mmetsp:Transcript_2946/g.8580  ORF Transcript_2946/g.8580 Transcript_2946/m.8580 type:complete len:205 (+) Transcript_2946:92-706(+)
MYFLQVLKLKITTMRAVETRRRRSLCYQRVARIQLRTVSFGVDEGDECSEEPALARHHTAQPARILDHTCIPVAYYTAEHFCPVHNTVAPFEAGVGMHIAAAAAAAPAPAAAVCLYNTARNKLVVHCPLQEMASSSRPLHWTMLLPVQKQQKHLVEGTHRRPYPATPDTSAPVHWFCVRNPHILRRMGACKGSPWSCTNLRTDI